ncbi:hypothetical protein EDB81DRAFT_786164 [Dactylonectria macrodidyma]|uniref:DUF2470 domain-containing protein n=1 Tax=Dactylonectria macrodidyma TaxID=307937 RepID=A0A9P9F656_9HYPO|nr:hypothetical protein EDB81DRAFT_786164 [Dactylonectria macrodidyma]
MDDAGSAHKARIIKHMNADHTREMSYYLRHYAGASAGAASSPEMLDIDLRGMRIAGRGGREYSVPFDPPLAGWAEARARIVEMAHTARETLGFSDVVVTAYARPRGFGLFVFSAVLFYFGCAASLPWVVPGSPAWQLLEAGFPGGPEGFVWIVRAIFWPVIGIHLLECYIFDARLNRHGVERFSGQWWAWESNCFLEGFPSFQRFDAIVAKKAAEKNAKKQ